MADKFATVDYYIASFPEDTRAILQLVRQSLHRAVPGADEKIRYAMPAIMLGTRYAIHFAAWKRHVGLYPVPRFDDELEAEIAPYRAAKDSVNFPYAKPVPYDLIERIATAIRSKRLAD